MLRVSFTMPRVLLRICTRTTEEKQNLSNLHFLPSVWAVIYRRSLSKLLCVITGEMVDGNGFASTDPCAQTQRPVPPSTRNPSGFWLPQKHSAAAYLSTNSSGVGRVLYRLNIFSLCTLVRPVLPQWVPWIANRLTDCCLLTQLPWDVPQAFLLIIIQAF